MAMANGARVCFILGATLVASVLPQSAVAGSGSTAGVSGLTSGDVSGISTGGVDGISTIDAYPNLRGQNKTYLISSLKDYKARERTSGLAVLMQQQADALSDQDIEDIAHYYSQLGKEAQP